MQNQQRRASAVRTWVKFRTGHLALQLLFWMAAAWSASTAMAQVDSVQSEVIEAIGQYATSTNDVIESAIRDLGYSPASQQTWKSLSTIGQLEAVYHAAEKA